MKRITKKQVRELLENSGRLRDGDLEMSHNAKVSMSSDNGAYVQVWIWVDFRGTKLDKEQEDHAENRHRL